MTQAEKKAKYTHALVAAKYKLIQEQQKELADMEKALAEKDAAEDAAASAQAAMEASGGRDSQEQQMWGKMKSETGRSKTKWR